MLRRFPEGTLVKAGERAVPALAAVLIDNMKEARPAAGLSRAPLVIEAPVEGGITRLLAFYPLDAAISKIGPVRSLRPYFLTLAEDFAVIIAHVGGSPEALSQETTSPLIPLNEFFHTLSFWRDQNRAAPHNMYTSVSRLSEAVLSRKKNPIPSTLNKNPWHYEESLATLKPQTPATTLTLNAADPAYTVTWQFDAASRRFTRTQGTRVHKDQDGVVVSAHNVIVLQVPISILDEVGRRAINLIGQGNAWMVRDGAVLKGLWQRSKETPLTFITPEGTPLPLHPGTTWIEIIPISEVPLILP